MQTDTKTEPECFCEIKVESRLILMDFQKLPGS